MIDQKGFLKCVTIFHDTREKENQHILDAFGEMRVKHELKKLDVGDYSFSISGRDFTLSCAIERKANPDELYSNIMEMPAVAKNYSRRGERIEKELDAAYRIFNDFTILIEGAGSMDELKEYKVPKWKMDISPNRELSEIGKLCYQKLTSWQAGNRYGFRIVFSKDRSRTAAKILEQFYYYYRNYANAVAPRR